jgi:hypothetical protein
LKRYFYTKFCPLRVQIVKKQDRRASVGFTWPRIRRNNALYSARKISSEALIEVMF